jgi:hypothetical protein
MTTGLSHLVVPINVEALCVNAKVPSGSFVPPVTSFQSLPYNDGSPQQTPFLSERALAQPFSTDSAAQGVHLHWAMPDALMHGEQVQKPAPSNVFRAEPQSLPLRFPRLPDRWLITRTELVTGGGPGKITSWVVDSRFVSETLLRGNVGSSAVPWENPGDIKPWENPDDTPYTRPPFRYLGRTLPIADWAAPTPAELLTELTAASLGFIQASAYYPSCRNVFGMHHPAPESNQAVEYSYVVCGWHSDPAHDPLHGKSAQDTGKALENLRWKAPHDGAFDGVLYVGIVHSVAWDPNREPDQPGTVTAIFGNTTSEANAALHSSFAAPNGRSAFGMQLQALLTGQLDRLHEPGGEQRVLRQFHQQRFIPASSGSVWYVADAADGADLFPSLQPRQQELLVTLNREERNRLARREDAAAAQWQLFADWYKYLKCKYREKGEDLRDAGDVRDFIQEQSLPLANLAIDAFGKSTTSTARAFADLSSTLIAPQELKAKPLPNFWRPVDPVLLLQGHDVKPAMRFGGDGELLCQVFGVTPQHSFLSALDLPADAIAGVGPARLDAAHDTPTLAPQIEKLGPPKAAFTAAALEALLLWPAWAGAALAARAGKPKSSADIAAWLAACNPEHSGSPWSGKAPAAKSITAWTGNPWLPIMMHWDIAYQPLAIIQTDKPDAAFPSNTVLSRIADTLNADEVDLVLNPPASHQLRDNTPRVYEGITFITPQAGERVKQSLRAHAAMHPHTLLASIEPVIENIPLLSQTLSGFHDRLLLRRQTFQIDIRDPFALVDSETEFATSVKAAVTALGSRVSTIAPIVQDAFNPVRGGDFSLQRLWLGDVFGQCRRFNFNSNSYRANTNGNRVIAAPALGRSDSSGSLKPSFPARLTQPMRLDFQWLAAAGDQPLTEEDPNASPICGWIVPNYLDRSLAIYDDTGDSLGSILAIEGRITWQGSPAHPQTFDLPPEDLFRNRNAQLRDFTLSFLSNPAQTSYLDGYLSALNAGTNTIQPLEAAQHAVLPLLVGQPLALTRVALKLSLAGPPAVNQTWSAFERDLDKTAKPGEFVKRTTNDHEDVDYPVVLGMSTDPDDGLVGFYQGAPTSLSRFSDFFVVANPKTAGPGITTSRVHTLYLKPSEPMRVITLLVDPRAQVIVTTGYAPAQSRTLPPQAVKDAFARLAVTFLTAPLLTTEPPPEHLGGEVSLPIPFPGQQKGQWNWLRVVNDKAGKQSAIFAGAVPMSPDKVLSANAVYLQDGWLSLQNFGDPE